MVVEESVWNAVERLKSKREIMMVSNKLENYMRHVKECA